MGLYIRDLHTIMFSNKTNSGIVRGVLIKIARFLLFFFNLYFILRFICDLNFTMSSDKLFVIVTTKILNLHLFCILQKISEHFHMVHFRLTNEMFHYLQVSFITGQNIGLAKMYFCYFITTRNATRGMVCHSWVCRRD